MPTPKDIYHQVKKLTADLVGLSLCDRQNFPALCDLGHGCQEVSIGDRGKISYALKNIPYHEIYSELERTKTYNLRMLDGALIQMMYRFRDCQVEIHRLAFFPSPFLEEFQNNPKIYLEDEIYAEVIKKNIVPFPFRFDFDCRDGVAVDVKHPQSHLTLGQYQNCRIPVSAPITPYHFIGFIMRNFYNTVFCKYYKQISAFSQAFNISITSREKEMIYIQAPT